MKNGYKLGLAAVAASIALVGCGGGSSSGTPTVTGNLFNTYVEGATYVCSSGTTGTTDEMGTYTCNEGDTVEFFLGKFSIGSADAAEGILDTDLLSADDTADTDLLQLLQGIDDESDGVITIPEDFTALDILVDLNVSLGDSDFETIIASDTNITLEDEKTAVDNHAENLLQAYLGGKTLYIAEDSTTFESASFDTNLTEMNLTNLITDTSEMITLTLQNGGLQVTGLGFLTLTEETEDYLLFTYNTDQTVKFYFDEAVANAVYQGIIPMTEAMLSGKTFYFTEAEYDNGDTNPKTGDLYTKLTFANGTVTVKDIWESATSAETGEMTNTAPYQLVEGKLKVDLSGMVYPDEAPEGYLWLELVDVTGEYWYLLGQDDANKDGVIDNPSLFDGETWYLTKPAGFPTAL